MTHSKKIFFKKGFEKMKKKLIIALSVVMAVSLAVGTTLAYLTDKVTEANVFTIGNVNIDFEEPYFPKEGASAVPGVAVEKYGIITNVGSEDAYVWATVAVPAAIYNYVDVQLGATWKTWQPLGQDREVEINGDKYISIALLCEDVLPANDEEGEGFDFTPLDSVTVDPRVDFNNEDGKYYIVEAGQATEIPFDLSNFAVYCSAYAIQAKGFNDVYEAYDAYMDQWGDKHFSDGAVFVKTQDAFDAAAAEDGAEVVLANGTYKLPATIGDGTSIRGNGNTVLDTSAIGKNIVVNDIAIDNVTIENEEAEALPISGTATITNCELSCERGPVVYNCYATGEIVFENCSISSPTYALNIIGEGDVIIRNSTIAGWCSFGGGVSVTIENCIFNKCELVPENSVLKFYGDATIYNTVFAPEMTIAANQASKDVTITLVGCSVSDGSDIANITEASNENGKTVTFDIQ